MDAAFCFYAGEFVQSKSIDDALVVLQTVWVSDFWASASIHGNQAFQADEFQRYLGSMGIKLRPVPSRGKSKNIIKSKHGVISDIFIRLKSANSEHSERLLVDQTIIIYNYIYGNDAASSYELVKDFTRLVTCSSPIYLPIKVRDAHEELIAERKINEIFI